MNKETSAVSKFLHISLNPFSTNVPLLYPLKTENLRFSDVFRGYRSGTLVGNRLKNYNHFQKLKTLSLPPFANLVRFDNLTQPTQRNCIIQGLK